MPMCALKYIWIKKHNHMGESCRKSVADYEQKK